VTFRRARYGALDNRHDLLDWEGRRDEAPQVLLGLTDQPVGHWGRGDVWWPAVGCGPVERFWALWWTVRDERAARGGMVRSEVALWPREEVGAVRDLRPALESIAGEATWPRVDEGLLADVAELLLQAGARPPVVVGQHAWPSLLLALWERLWPEARASFAARVALQPPPGGDSVVPVTLFCTPPPREIQWGEHPRAPVTHGSRPTRTRAGRFLVGQPDETMAEVLAATQAGGGTLRGLGRVARTADALDVMRSAPGPEAAARLLRELVASRHTPSAASLQREALDVLVARLAEAPFSFLATLRNLPLAEDVDALEQALKRRLHRDAPLVASEASGRFWSGFLAADVSPWWRRAAEAAFRDGFDELDDVWAEATLRWLDEEEPSNAIRDLLPSVPAVEAKLLAGVTPSAARRGGLTRLRAECARRRWPSLHAWAAKESLSPAEALREHRAQRFEEDAGVDLLVRWLPGAALVSAAVESGDPWLIDRVAARTAREPEWLRSIEAEQAGWLRLWEAHVRFGGEPWPVGLEQGRGARAVLDATLRGQSLDALIARCAAQLAPAALTHPERERLWGGFEGRARSALLEATAIELLRACEAAPPAATPEAPLRDALRALVPSTRLSVRALPTLIMWGLLGEKDVLGPIRSCRSEDLTSVGVQLGEAASRLGWKDVASALYERWRSYDVLHGAVERCKDLLSGLQRLWFDFRRMESFDERRFAARLADVAAEACPRELDRLWRLAGGEIRVLESTGTARERWWAAIERARQGGLENGLDALLDVLSEEIPDNHDLRELRALYARACRTSRRP
jgi:hypothetical protein